MCQPHFGTVQPGDRQGHQGSGPARAVAAGGQGQRDRGPKGIEALHAAQCGVQRGSRRKDRRLYWLVLCDAGRGRQNLYPSGNGIEP